MTTSFQIQHSAMLLKYSGISFISGAVNHGFFSGERSLWTAAVGIVLFVAGAWMEHRSQNNSESLIASLWVGTLLSIGLGFFTGGLQHFPDSPARSAWVVPLGFAISILALMFTLKMRMQRALLAYSLSLGLVVCASSWAAYEVFERNPEWAALGHAHGSEDSHDQPANALMQSAMEVTRTIQVDMNDSMRFTPDVLQVAAGEAVKLVVHNSGKLPHEMVLGSEAALKAHAVEMQKLAGKSTGQVSGHASGHADEHHHGAGNDFIELSVNPGETKEWVIRFDKAQTLQMACLIPGHFEAGMKGQLRVENKGPAVPSSISAKPANSHDHSSHKH
jgi:uncharacterized cupredoxin-like copper-binding protein